MRSTMIIAFISLLLIVGCNTTEGPREYNFHTGTQGIYLEFMPNAPPNTIYGNDEANVMVKYYNKGVYDIQPGEGVLYLSGYDPSMFSFFPTGTGSSQGGGYPIDDADPKSEFNPQGTLFRIAEWSTGANGVSVPQGVDFIDQRIKATACYIYRTVEAVKVCLDPDPYNQKAGTKVCHMNSVSGGTGGAPVTVSSVKPDVVGDRLQFTIYFKNAGGGDTFVRSRDSYTPNDPRNCNNDIEHDEIDQVWVERVEISGNDITGSCQPQLQGSVNGLKRMINGQGFMYCFCDSCLANVQEAYETVLNIQLAYGYRNSIWKNVRVRNNPSDWS